MPIQHRPLKVIAQEIKANWTKPYYGAVPYIEALETGNKITDKYIIGNYESIVLGFLANASTWRGEVAKRVKAELKAMLKPQPRSIIIEQSDID